ncbi:MAG: hypothetical protein UX13_C0011G0010 [Candidatus Woesebacteria bacterium GW2011_GWB1_45_5]|uniref:Soluble ligand binding domain-containing protein n=1 Tax=Candidatus Woesebacteria bacterium GW2011_GWB1_45_5 TaxID=1618581 RepID=A0A0G1MQJ9_9BACT|nr:MAG: hypothetical protein UX13_C0011G0010 [Candidatus Woesebacteria bacterium GW2011_GWB1_45_5]
MENWLTSSRNRHLLLSGLLGLILLGAGILLFRKDLSFSTTKVEVIDATSENGSETEITAEIAGSVENPGVYRLSGNSRIEDLLVLAGGFSEDADRIWTEKYLNRAAKLTDGQKVFIPGSDQQSESSSANKSGDIKVDQPVLGAGQTDLVDINTASLSGLDTLPGIGPVYGQSIIDHRPYSTVEELLSKGALKKSVYEKIKDMVSVY